MVGVVECTDVLLIYPSHAGLFRSSKRYYAWKTGSTFSILAAALTLLFQYHESMVGIVASALLLGLFWQQVTLSPSSPPSPSPGVAIAHVVAWHGIIDVLS